MRSIFHSTLRQLYAPLGALRTKRLAALIGEYMERGENVLEVGCGNLKVGQEIVRTRGVSWIGIDVIDHNETSLELKLYDGKTLPFEAGRFSAVLLSFMLHHCDNPAAVIEECMRVSRKKIIILEDIVGPRAWSRPLACWHDYLANRLFWPDIPVPYQFKTRQEWLKLFANFDLKVVAERKLKTHPLAFVNQTLFVVEC